MEDSLELNRTLSLIAKPVDSSLSVLPVLSHAVCQFSRQFSAWKITGLVRAALVMVRFAKRLS